MALAITPERDPDETPEDRDLAYIVTAVFAVLALVFLVWLVWVYLL